MSPDRPVDADGSSPDHNVTPRLPPPAALYCHRAHRSCARRYHPAPGSRPRRVARGAGHGRPRALMWSLDLHITHRCVRRHGQHVLLTQTRQATTKPRRSSHLVVTRNPSMRQRGTVFLQHLQGQLVTRTIGPGRFGHARFVQARRILGPFFWQIQPGVDQGVPLAGDIAQVDGYLAVIDFAQTATPFDGLRPPTPDRTWETQKDRTPTPHRFVPSAS